MLKNKWKKRKHEKNVDEIKLSKKKFRKQNGHNIK